LIVHGRGRIGRGAVLHHGYKRIERPLGIKLEVVILRVRALQPSH